MTPIRRPPRTMMRPDMHEASDNTLVLDEVLDAASCSAMRRFQRRARRSPRSHAAIDLRRTRSTPSAAWGVLVKLIRDLTRSGHGVTVVASVHLIGLMELTGLTRHARVVIV